MDKKKEKQQIRIHIFSNIKFTSISNDMPFSGRLYLKRFLYLNLFLTRTILSTVRPVKGIQWLPWIMWYWSIRISTRFSLHHNPLLVVKFTCWMFFSFKKKKTKFHYLFSLFIGCYSTAAAVVVIIGFHSHFLLLKYSFFFYSFVILFYIQTISVRVLNL